MKLGDLVYYFTKTTGIHWLTKKLFKDCGCDRRRQRWNNLFTRNKNYSNNAENDIFI